MNIRNSAPVLFWIAVVISTNVVAKDIAIYRWVDENNVVHFSQHQPTKGNYSQLTTVSSYRAKEKDQAQSVDSSSEGKQLSQFEKENAQVFAKNEAIAKKNCKAAQLNEKMLNSLDKVMITDANGKSRTLTEKERKEQLSISKEHISLYCVN